MKKQGGGKWTESEGFLSFKAETILNIPLSYNLPEDKIIWVGNKRGMFYQECIPRSLAIGGKI